MISLPVYKEQEGTVKISGVTVPRKAGFCAYHFLHKGIAPIDFLCIGVNANQQATKAMGVFKYLVDHEMGDANISIAFQPLRFQVVAKNKETQEEKLKDCTVWRTIILEKKREDTEKSISV
jgi:hypothetical protein